ncbi:phosphate ABC transporter substrate-binding protein PstS [Nocardia sp. NPDC051570]|uniref:phosphate ABC transporter substrate-binding protein PstS n=1 Tax=Nocardia sp. NPDC051570 TaxID=3364324 RepID=UPI0037BB946B
MRRSLVNKSWVSSALGRGAASAGVVVLTSAVVYGAAGAGHAADIRCDGSGQLSASGSSAQKNAMDSWVATFTAACPNIQIDYKPTGSGAGIQDFLAARTAFAGSDSALTPDEITKSKDVLKGGQAIDLPMVGGPIALGYNVPGVDSLVLDADTLAKIFDGKISRWNDDAIARLNRGAALPDLAIQPFHRSDQSGTTDNFTRYLHAAAAQSWPYAPAQSWPTTGGPSADGSAGVSAQVRQTPGAISYFELSYATAGSIKTVKLATGASAPVEATSDNASRALAQAMIVGTGGDLALQLDYGTQAEGAYPITLVTYEIVGDKGNRADTLPATRSFLTYIASADGQSVLAGLGYAPLPADIAAKVRDTIAGIS